MEACAFPLSLKMRFLLLLFLWDGVLGQYDEEGIISGLVEPPVPVYEPDYIMADGDVIDSRLFSREFFTIPAEKASMAAIPSVSKRTRSFGRQTEEPFYADDYRALTNGLTTLNTLDGSSRMVLFGEDAFPLSLNGDGDVSFAAATYQQGKVVVSGHRRSLFYDYEDNLAFVANAVRWVSGGAANPKIGSFESLKLNGFPDTEQNVPTAGLWENGYRVYALNSLAAMTDEQATDIVSFVSAGGGLIVGGQGWWWHSNNPQRSFTNFPGNKVLSQFGMLITTYNWSPQNWPVSDIPTKETNLYFAMQAIATNPENAVAMRTVQRSFPIVTHIENGLNPVFEPFIKMAAGIMSDTEDKRLFSSLAPTLYPLLMFSSSYDSYIGKAPDVAIFPYETPNDAAIVDETVEINGNTNSQPSEYWYSYAGKWEMRSTGLYAKAGTKVTFTIPESVVGNVHFMIGCHTDYLYHKDAPARSPEIVISFPTHSTSGSIASPWGGLIYVTLPHNSALGMFDISLSNVVKAPYFIFGTHTNADWINGIRDLPAPWAELEVPGSIIFSVPSSSIRGLDDPEEWAQFWEEEFLVANKFGALENGERARTERFVFDLEISSGGMHSGYPLMGYIYGLTSDSLLNATTLRNEGTWGAFHEIGHNMQWSRYTTSTTVETGCNWWSIVMNEYLESGGYQHIQVTSRDRRVHDWVMRGKPWSEWEVWLALDTFHLLAQEFGWKSYTDTIKIYYENQSIDRDLNSDEKKLNKWVERYSQVVNKNLCPYFQWWNFPLTNATIAACSELPTWEPAVNPLDKYTHPTEHRGDCLEGWEAYGDSCFFFSDDRKTWFDAEATCAEVPGSHLASCIDGKDFAFLSKMKPHTSIRWIGIDDLKVHNDWVSLDGSPISPTDGPIWMANKPSPDDKRHCGILNNGQTEDWECLRREKFICQYGENSCGPLAGVNACPPGWTYFSSNCYLFQYGETSQQTAEGFCQAEEASLLEIVKSGIICEKPIDPVP